MCRRLFQDGYPDSIVQETIDFCRISFCGRCQICGELPAGSWNAEKPGGIEAFYLQRKGISREIIREQLEETEHDSGEAIRVLLEKKHYKAGDSAGGGKKIIAYLMRRGFSWEDIRREMKEQGGCI